VIANLYQTITTVFELPAAAGPLVLKLRGVTGASTMNVLNSAANPSTLTVYDVGPV
jgi:hypothetical protein